MALFHLSVTQTKRSAGQSAIASAAYRAGERLYSEYYGEYSDYTRKGGVICSDILLPSHAPPEFADRQTLWNAVEKAERGKNAQLAYSFDIALQNEFSLEENIALARQFLLENFVSRGMVVDFAVHQPDREDGGIPNPHFHVLCPIRPIEQNGKWGLIHNHIIYNSTALDSTRKFRDFLLSGLAVQRLSDLICLEYQLSVIEIKPYRERQKRTLYPPRESNRDKLCTVIDNILLNEKPADFEAFLQKLEQQGYEIKRGKHTSVKGARQKRFIRFRTLGAGYSEDEIKAVIAGEAEHRPHQKQPPKEKPFHLLVDIQAKLSEGKSESYARWAKRYNLKEMSKTLIFLQENKIGNIEEMQERVNAATARYHELGDSIKAAEQRMAEIAVLRAHIINYAKTRPVYDAYRKAGYSKKFLEEHREQITLHRAAKATFDEAGLKKLPKVKELNTEYSTLLSQKKAAYPAYRKARDEMQELMKAQKNVEIFFAEEKTTKEKAQTR